jgi:hypothetical protein
MNLLRSGGVSLFVAAALFPAAGCHRQQAQSADNESQTTAQQDQGQDPADANLTPATYTTSGSPSAPAAGSDQSQAAPNPDSYANSPAPAGDEEAEQPTETAPQPPPPLPDYDQPPCPGDGYIWTPGYWAYAPTGYYWVPGVWVAPPYSGALWTPGYWAFSAGHYGWFPGHWGLHIGFYGGVNYGFGYVGSGYEGGYWNSGHFTYNRVYNNVNTTVIHNVYNYNANTRIRNVTRVSFNGGQGGVVARPGPAELAARREPYAPRMTTQVTHEQTYRANRQQFVAVNHGRPQNLVETHPLEADRNVRPIQPGRAPARPEPHPAPHPQPGRPGEPHH